MPRGSLSSHHHLETDRGEENLVTPESEAPALTTSRVASRGYNFMERFFSHLYLLDD